jgi:hypothetical protein
LEKWQNDVVQYVPRLLSVCKAEKHTKVVFFIDNVDQLAPAYQAQIFLLGQRIARIVNAVTVIALREESYYTASVQKTFTAYTNRKFHIASPHFLRLIQNRLEYALSTLEGPDGLKGITDHGIQINRDDIRDYLRIVGSSIFETSRKIERFVESICFGNMRLALDMFTTFLASGATDVDKMLFIYRTTSHYTVAFHEFFKSIALGDRRYYKETNSPIVNVFDCGLEKNSSHFTALRLLRLLLKHRAESTPEGDGYVEVSQTGNPNAQSPVTEAVDRGQHSISREHKRCEPREDNGRRLVLCAAASGHFLLFRSRSPGHTSKRDLNRRGVAEVRSRGGQSV